MKTYCTLFGILGIILFSGVRLQADDLTIPHIFREGTTARAAEVNDNFTAVKGA